MGDERKRLVKRDVSEPQWSNRRACGWSVTSQQNRECEVEAAEADGDRADGERGLCEGVGGGPVRGGKQDRAGEGGGEDWAVAWEQGVRNVW